MQCRGCRVWLSNMQVYQGRDAKISFCVHAQTMHVYEVRPRRRRDLRDDMWRHVSGVRPRTKSSLKSLNFLDTHRANYARTPAPLQQTKANAGVQGGVLYDAGERREHRPPAHGFDIGHFSMNREPGREKITKCDPWPKHSHDAVFASTRSLLQCFVAPRMSHNWNLEDGVFPLYSHR
jgi:hypothetical protein